MRTAMRSGDWLAIVLDELVVPATLNGRYKLSRMLVLVYASENWRILILFMIYWLSPTPYPENRVFSLQRDSTSHPHTCYSKISSADLIGSPEIEAATKYRAMTDRGRRQLLPQPGYRERSDLWPKVDLDPQITASGARERCRAEI